MCDVWLSAVLAGSIKTQKYLIYLSKPENLYGDELVSIHFLYKQDDLIYILCVLRAL